jgi:hypothetical protein
MLSRTGVDLPAAPVLFLFHRYVSPPRGRRPTTEEAQGIGTKIKTTNTRTVLDMKKTMEDHGQAVTERLRIRLQQIGGGE